MRNVFFANANLQTSEEYARRIKLNLMCLCVEKNKFRKISNSNFLFNSFQPARNLTFLCEFIFNLKY